MVKRPCDPIRLRWPHLRTGATQVVAPAQRLPRNAGERGSGTVEFALAALILCCILFGMIELSLGLYSAHFVAEAAQQATRFAQVRGYYCTGLAACPAQASDIQTYVRGLSHPGINTSSIQVSTSYSGYPAGTTCSPSATCNNPGNLVTVTVTYSFSLMAMLPGVGPQGVRPTPTAMSFSSTAAAVILN